MGLRHLGKGGQTAVQGMEGKFFPAEHPQAPLFQTPDNGLPVRLQNKMLHPDPLLRQPAREFPPILGVDQRHRRHHGAGILPAKHGQDLVVDLTPQGRILKIRRMTAGRRIAPQKIAGVFRVVAKSVGQPGAKLPGHSGFSRPKGAVDPDNHRNRPFLLLSWGKVRQTNLSDKIDEFAPAPCGFPAAMIRWFCALVSL